MYLPETKQQRMRTLDILRLCDWLRGACWLVLSSDSFPNLFLLRDDPSTLFDQRQGSPLGSLHLCLVYLWQYCTSFLLLLFFFFFFFNKLVPLGITAHSLACSGSCLPAQHSHSSFPFFHHLLFGHSLLYLRDASEMPLPCLLTLKLAAHPSRPSSNATSSGSLP